MCVPAYTCSPVSFVLQNLLDEIASREQEVQKVYMDSQQYQQAVKVSHEPCKSTQEGLLIKRYRETWVGCWENGQ